MVRRQRPLSAYSQGQGGRTIGFEYRLVAVAFPDDFRNLLVRDTDQRIVVDA